MRLRLPAERPAEPPTGYKIAHPVLSQDGTRAGFTGVSLGGALPYGVLDQASCVYGRRHRPPARLCDCGFHCVHDRATADALRCTAEHRTALLLEVSVLGAYLRFERGFRYARQRVRTATAGPCACGATASLLADAGWGRPGWRALAPGCAGCTRGRTSVTLAEFARLAGEGLRVRADDGAPAETVALLGAGTGMGVPELVAEAALLQARLDWFQSQLARLGDRGTGGADKG
ncbi:hypothetical protein GTY81_05575 [Streptomyces sp. SID8366]|uniref:hypothetical protein n=1 Tax=unclassified Streptomyces TaxID=2593676 RepID=UPI000DB9253C|nr:MULTISPECIES: hypothetical protein [Streptomyces]MYU03377.1 hypothetical protein [Streptomyces sp. SID8366]MYU63972.1 hypothetical protein [Streptomyces sp. SID69]RAJ51432.1 hypothetical protein K376_06119 [Streptomyces sp. PsTaAH-130]TXJ72714.1 hypothetical protein E2C11_30135 [Streptomyces lavendulae]